MQTHDTHQDKRKYTLHYNIS